MGQSDENGASERDKLRFIRAGTKTDEAGYMR